MPEFAQGPGQCCNDCGTCCFTCCCPCFAFYQAAENAGSQNGILYLLVTFPLGFGCCALTALGNEIAEKRGIEMGLPKSAVCAFFDCCVCYSCSVVNEAKLMKDGQPNATAPMERK